MARNLSDAESIQAQKVGEWVYNEITGFGQPVSTMEMISREMIIEALVIDDEIDYYTEDERSKLLGLL